MWLNTTRTMSYVKAINSSSPDLDDLDVLAGEPRFLATPPRPVASAPQTEQPNVLLESDLVNHEPDLSATNVLQASSAFNARKLGSKSVNTLQEWEGYVDRIDDEHFEATVVDARPGHNEEQIVTVPLQIVPDFERKHLKLGALFNLIVGLSRSENGERQKDVIVYFRKFNALDENRGKVAADLLRKASFE